MRSMISLPEVFYPRSGNGVTTALGLRCRFPLLTSSRGHSPAMQQQSVPPHVRLAADKVKRKLPSKGDMAEHDEMRLFSVSQPLVHTEVHKKNVQDDPHTPHSSRQGESPKEGKNGYEFQSMGQRHAVLKNLQSSHLRAVPPRNFPRTQSNGANGGEGSPRSSVSEVTFSSTPTDRHLNSTNDQPQVERGRQRRRCSIVLHTQSDNMGPSASINTDLALGPTSLSREQSRVARMTAAVSRSPTDASPGSGVDNKERADGGHVWFPSRTSSSPQMPVGVGDECPPFGMLAVLGRRREMEDFLRVQSQVITVPRLCAGPSHRSSSEEWAAYGSAAFSSPAIAAEAAALHYFGVFDGHGGVGAARYCSDRLHLNLAEEMGVQAELRLDPDTVEQRLARALLSAFCRTDDEIGGKCPHPSLSGPATEPVAPDAVGTTAIVALVGPNQIVVANCGDSRAVLCRGGVALPLSLDHKPDRPDEMQRVEAAGGRVVYFNGYRVLGVLAMSRAIGDRCLKPYVIATPEITCTKRTLEDECIIMATDGLWDVLTNEEVCEIARKCVLTKCTTSPFSADVNSPLLGQDLQSATAAALLTKIALARGSTDNISVLVIKLSSNLTPDAPSQCRNMN